MRTLASQRARQLQEERVREEQHYLEHQANQFARLADRTSLARDGLNNLRALGGTKEVQELLRVHDGSILLWGDEEQSSPGYDMKDVVWKYVTHVTLLQTEVRAQYHVHTISAGSGTFKPHPVFPMFDLRFSYGKTDEFKNQFGLWMLASTQSYGGIAAMERRDDKLELFSPEALFEVFIECSTKKGLRRLFRNAIAVDRHLE